ncbi:PIN domain-containing protein [Parachryseolinea silvisoli]|uniref:PIN domain-containing protein n=1 Tax=Parachryseolinea silvisoli TaxID=2873601 RepID=UPI002265F119|nr:PIN domain-containing protein [Parachryseolinea silvisoli]MCD9015195.1 PIN domain-containing protein [Parachryseolinea silvisoli]
MLYLSLDSDIWLNSLNEVRDGDSYFDSLEYWIEGGHVTILLPNIIIEEWERNRANKIQIMEKEWKSFFNRAKKYLPPESFRMLMTPEKLAERAEESIKRVETIFEHYAIKIPITTDHKLRAVEMAEKKLAPFGQRNSIGDAYIFLSLTDYISFNGLTNCVFITNNHTDFSRQGENGRIHPDLESVFTNLAIGYYVELGKFFREYGSRLPAVPDHEKRILLKDEDKKLAQAVRNPQTVASLTGLRDSYIDNTNHLDLICKSKNPTQHQVAFALDLVRSDTSYEQYFYQRLESPVWFKILAIQGAFDPNRNPAPVTVAQGVQFPLWTPLLYLQKLSQQIRDGNGMELANDLIAIVNAVSVKPVDNFRTWSFLIRILVNLPNESIPASTLEYVPAWLSGKFDTMMQSQAITENLLPKFLPEQPTAQDAGKAEIILMHLFSLQRRNSEKDDSEDVGSYGSRVYMHYLADALVKRKLTSKIAAHCSDRVIITLADSIKKLRVDFPNGIPARVRVGALEYTLRIDLDNLDLLLSISIEDAPDNTFPQQRITGFGELNDGELRDAVIALLKDVGISYEDSEANDSELKQLARWLEIGTYRVTFDEAISKAQNRSYTGEKVTETFSFIFKDLVTEKVIYDPVAGLSLLKTFAFDAKYRLPYFRRVVLFVVGEKWADCKALFWDMVGDNDPMFLFSRYEYEKDLYELLHKVQHALTAGEIEKLRAIIERGRQDEGKEHTENYRNYWKMRWYAALRNTPPFSEYYRELSQSANITYEHFENEGKIVMRGGSESPLTREDLLRQSNADIASFIQNFKPTDRWDGPSIDGLASVLGSAIKEAPEKFADEIDHYLGTYYLYAYHIALGFRDAWQAGRSFNWENVLAFFTKYLIDRQFLSGDLRLENDGWGASADWVTGAVGNLLTAGMQSDERAFDVSLLPEANAIVKTLASNLGKSEELKGPNVDYPTYSLNSTGGKVLRAALDYSLRRARTLPAESDQPRWEPAMIEIFEHALQVGVIDASILTGWYFSLFYYLDKHWITDKVKAYYNADEYTWLAFMGGYTYSNPLSDLTVYELFRPHYQRAIDTNAHVNGRYEHGTIRHIVAYYFWGIEDLGENGMLARLINANDHENTLDLVNFVSRQKDYLVGLSEEDAGKVERAIFELWRLLAAKYARPATESERRVLAGLIVLLVFVPELNDANTDLAVQSCKMEGELYLSHYLIENLLTLIGRGNTSATAKHMGVILLATSLAHLVTSAEENDVIELIQFLYDHGQHMAANELCNRMVKAGHEFLRPLHRKYSQEN